MALFSSLFWIIVLIVALSNVERGFKLLEPFFKKPNFQAMLPPSSRNVPINLPPIKSENYIASTVEEQQQLLDFESILTEFLTDKRNKPASITESSVETHRWTQATCPPIAQLPESVINEVSKLIMCSNAQIRSCDGVKEIVDKALFGIKTSKRIILGFRMNLEAPQPCSAARYRNKLHKTFHKLLWPAIKSVIDFSNEDREIIFVGYESGGSLASLAAWMTSKQFEQFNPPGIVITNGNNQIKVITWDEIPLYTIKTAQKYPILARNHFHFSTQSIAESKFREISQFSGGIDEVQYFATNGEEIKIKSADYTDFSVRLTSTTRSTMTADNSEDDSTAWNPLVNMAMFLKPKDLTELEPDRLDKLKELLFLHRDHLSIINSIIFNTFNSFLVGTKLAEPKACADSLANQLASTIFVGDSIIKCRVDNFDVIKGSFKIFCSYKSASSDLKPLAQFLSFDAVLGDAAIHEEGNDCQAFMDEVEIEDPKDADKKKKKKKKGGKGVADEKPKMIKVRKYSGPAPAVDSWTVCLHKLFDQRPHIASIISPFRIKEKRIYPHCSYVPFEPSSLSSASAAFSNAVGKGNTGCYLRAPNIGHELLQVYRADALFFYRSTDPTSIEFPDLCEKVLFHIPFGVMDKPALPALQQVGVEYLTQLVGRNPIERTDVTLWTPRDTESYKTIAYFGTTNIDHTDLADRSLYKNDFENSLIKCLSSPSFPYRDCTSALNRWIPQACPKACSLTHGAINFLCKQVKSCPKAGYYVSLSQEGNSEDLNSIKTLLMSNPNPQFGFFHVQTKGKNPLSSFYANVNFNVALFRMPA